MRVFLISPEGEQPTVLVVRLVEERARHGRGDDGDLEHGHRHIAELLAPEGAMVCGGAKALAWGHRPNISHQDFLLV